MRFNIGVDFGGTYIKAGIVGTGGEISNRLQRPTMPHRNAGEIGGDILNMVLELRESCESGGGTVMGVGLAIAGVEDADGKIVYANNLSLGEFTPRLFLQEHLKLPVVIENDANAAALGEYVAGNGKNSRSFLMVTLGTGIGGGMVLDGSILRGFNGAAGEIGHMVIRSGGRRCTCGRRGCFEAYASVTALVAATKKAAARHPESIMCEIAKEAGYNGKTAFDALRRSDTVAATVIERYVNEIACGIANLVLVFQPEVIGVGGAISREKEMLIAPLREKVYAEIMNRQTERPRISSCALGGDAGIIGVAMAALHSG